MTIINLQTVSILLLSKVIPRLNCKAIVRKLRSNTFLISCRDLWLDRLINNQTALQYLGFTNLNILGPVKFS